ncbi:hypothetical protein PUN28_006920 [Cardiocondyla obscurior]
MQGSFKEKKMDSENESGSANLNSRSAKENMDVASEGDEDSEKDIENDETDETDKNLNAIRSQNQNTNQNININANLDHGKRNRNKRHKRNKLNSPKRIEDVATVTEKGTLEEIAKEEISTNCVTNNKKNQRYSSSFVGNLTNRALTLEKEFHDVVGNDSKVKKSSSVHEGEDITLCWIETTTIKEDKTVQPTKRLVIREYTISFENSATIPEKYLECKKYEGELAANDPDTGKTALFEIIDEDTMVSRIVNFTSVSHTSNVTTWEHKKVKCGVGPVVSKDIVELNDGSKNPKKRVEIKISPKMHQLTATTTEEEPCTETSEETGEGNTFTESIEGVTGLSCKNGVCEVTVTPSILTKSTNEISADSEETSSESENEEDRSLPTDAKTLADEQVSRRSTTFPELSTTIQESHEKVDCEENSSDPACVFPSLSAQASTEAPEISTLTSDEVTSEEEVSFSSVEKRVTRQPLFTSEEKTRYSSEETTPTDNSEKFSEERVFQTTDEVSSVDDDSTSIKITDVEGVGDSTETTSEEVEKIDHAPDSSTNVVISREVDTEPDVTTAISSDIEFTKRPGRLDQILDKLSEPSVSTETATEAAESSTSEEIFSKESKESDESATSAIDETTIGLQDSSEEEEFTSETTESRAQIRSTTLLPERSTEVDRLCENSEECAHATSSEACDEFGNCRETTTKCNSEICSGENEDESKFDISPPMRTEISLSPTSSESFEESTTIKTQYTTVANIAATVLTSRESESNLTAINTISNALDTRRSTTISTPQHKLSLKVKVLLEHINENKEKQNLVEVEKYLSLDEIPGHHDDPNLLEQIKSLNDSVNRETLNALLNCTSLGNLTRHSSIASNKNSLDDIDDSDEEVEYTTNSDVENSIPEQFASEIDSKNDYSDYEESEVSSRRRKRSLEAVKLNRFVRQTLYGTTDFTINSFNTSEFLIEQTKDNSTLFTTTNYTEEVTTENQKNVTEPENVSEISSITTSVADFSNVTEFHDANLTTENIQLTTIGNKSEEKTSSAVYTDDTENESNVSAIPSTTEVNNETKLEVVRETLPGIQEDVVVGLRHMVSQLAQSNLTSALNNIKESFKTNLLSILADPKDTRARSRRKRAATEEVGHWSNERIKEAPMGGNLRSLTEFTLYKVLP